MSTTGRSELEQSVANYRKVARAAIRLKHSIAADNELNALMPALEAHLQACLQSGLIPAITVDEVLAMADGEKA